jgi:hypothetical protein
MGTGAWQKIAEAISAEQGVEIDQLHLLPPAGQPAVEQPPITEGNGPKQGDAMTEEGQPAFDAIGVPPGLEAGDLHHHSDDLAAGAHGREVGEQTGLLGGQRKRHPEAAGQSSANPSAQLSVKGIKQLQQSLTFRW